MSNYYYIATALPELKLGVAPEITFPYFVYLLQENLSSGDFEQARAIRRYFDIENIRAFWRKEAIDPRGNLDVNSLEEALVTGTGLPSYVYDFMDKHDSLQDRLRHFPFLIVTYFNEEISKAKGFLKKYLQFERDLRLVLVGLRAKKLHRDLLVELQYEDPEDNMVAQLLSQKDAKSYDPPEDYEAVKALFEEFSDDPASLNKALYEYRIQTIDQMIGLQVFTLDYILAYLVKLIYMEKWLEQDRDKGIQIIKKIINGAT